MLLSKECQDIGFSDFEGQAKTFNLEMASLDFAALDLHNSIYKGRNCCRKPCTLYNLQPECTSDREVVVMPSDRAVVVMPSDRGVVVMPSDRAVVVMPNDRGVVVMPSDRAVVVMPSDRGVVVMPSDRVVVVMPSDRGVVVMPSDRGFAFRMMNIPISPQRSFEMPGTDKGIRVNVRCHFPSVGDSKTKRHIFK
eukprot:g44981.t1